MTRYWWLAIWPDGEITRGNTTVLLQAIEATDRCVVCTIQSSKDAAEAMVPTLEKKFKAWGGEPWKTELKDNLPTPGTGRIRNPWKPKPKKKR